MIEIEENPYVIALYEIGDGLIQTYRLVESKEMYLTQTISKKSAETIRAALLKCSMQHHGHMIVEEHKVTGSDFIALWTEVNSLREQLECLKSQAPHP